MEKLELDKATIAPIELTNNLSLKTETNHPISRTETKLTVLAFGGGQDSTTILYKIILDPSFREKWIHGDLLILMSDTGNEHPHTYSHISFIEDLCRRNGIAFCFITSDKGYHPKTWPSLTAQFEKNSTIMSLAYPRTCTDNLKIKPLYNYLDHYIAQTYYDYTEETIPKGKAFIKRFVKDFGRIKVILGIAAGEEKRIAKSERKSRKAQQLNLFKTYRDPIPKWMTECIEKTYPLIEECMDRSACQTYIRAVGFPLPYPSNCIMCPYLSKIEILWLFKNMPDQFARWVTYENAKLEKCKEKVKRNLGVKGEQRLNEILQDAIQEFGHMTDEELNEYKMSHGHCVLSSY
ncbi:MULTISPECIES: hypothetical protein [Sphingobacterium]|uniref:hypothetical protein n=1 Tax=Sphingobacterium TaxID=28453 RepID=UPI00257C6C4B|nr:MULTISPECIES: hypothetical protein [Sphingobacterium]